MLIHILVIRKVGKSLLKLIRSISAQKGRESRISCGPKGEGLLDFDFQYEYKMKQHVLSKELRLEVIRYFTGSKHRP